LCRGAQNLPCEVLPALTYPLRVLFEYLLGIRTSQLCASSLSRVRGANEFLKVRVYFADSIRQGSLCSMFGLARLFDFVQFDPGRVCHLTYAVTESRALARACYS